MTGSDFTYLSAREIARLIRTKKVSPVEVVNSTLARIADVNTALNCFCFVYHHEALAAAEAAERACAHGEVLGPLHGVPVAFKDFTPIHGKITTLGSKVYEYAVTDRSALVVERVLGAGAILIGKTTTPEFAASGFTRSSLWGITRNPWDPERTPGGSSGGSAVAVATGCVALAEGSDMGGSVRIPAALCGTVGLKPSFGRIPFDVLESQFDTFNHFGPLARSVGDAALFLSVAQGPDDRDIQSLPNQDRIDLPLNSDIRGKSIALSIDLGYYHVDPEIEREVRAAAGSLREAGALVEEVDLNFSRELNDAWNAHWSVYLAAYFGQHLKIWREQMDPYVVSAIEAGMAMSAVDFKRIEFVRTRFWKAMASLFKRYDALICPTTAVTAPLATGKDSDFDYDGEDGRFHGYDMTMMFSLVGQCPAMSVPAGRTSAGLPVGLQIVGHRFDDVGVLRIGAALERVRPWDQLHPPV